MSLWRRCSSLNCLRFSLQPIKNAVGAQLTDVQFFYLILGQASLLITKWFPCGTTVRYEYSASTMPLSLSVTWEHSNQLGRISFLLIGAKCSCVVFTFIPTTYIKTAKLRKEVRSASYLTTQPRLLSVFQLSKSQRLPTGLPQNLSTVGQVPAINHHMKVRIMNL